MNDDYFYIHNFVDMANIVTLLFICMFIFAVLGVSFFGDSCPKYFGSLGKGSYMYMYMYMYTEKYQLYGI